MLIHPGEGKPPVCIDYRETAPAASRRLMYRGRESRLGHAVVGVPGTVRGLELAHKQFGKLPWKRLVEPAVTLARDGFELDEALANSLNEVLAQSADFVEFRRVYRREDDQPWKRGDRLRLADLAATLERIGEEGPGEFYTGKTARQVTAEMQHGGGLISAADLAGYEAIARKPIHGTFRGFDVYGPPPPSSGGICLVEMLNILERFDLKQHDRFSAATLHAVIEAQCRAFVDRARYLGDPAFNDIPARLTTKEYAKELAAGIDPEKATTSVSLAGDIPLYGEGDSTTHFSIVDDSGMAVSNTYTLEQSYGSRVVVRGAGFLLNNEMGDFNWRPGYTNLQGTIGTRPNQIDPGKRMLSSQTPTILARDGRPVLITGSPGGRTIINTVLCVVLNVAEFELDLPTAVKAPRLHHQWLPDIAYFEGLDDPRYEEAIKQLRAMGHKIETRAPRTQGDAHSIIRQGDRWQAVADERISGSAGGY